MPVFQLFPVLQKTYASAPVLPSQDFASLRGDRLQCLDMTLPMQFQFFFSGDLQLRAAHGDGFSMQIFHVNIPSAIRVLLALRLLDFRYFHQPLCMVVLPGQNSYIRVPERRYILQEEFRRSRLEHLRPCDIANELCEWRSPIRCQ